jgi:hypothetical protein
VVIPKVHHTTTAQSAGFQGLGGGALNKLFAKCINFALLAAMQNVITFALLAAIILKFVLCMPNQ